LDYSRINNQNARLQVLQFPRSIETPVITIYATHPTETSLTINATTSLSNLDLDHSTINFDIFYILILYCPFEKRIPRSISSTLNQLDKYHTTT